MKKFLPILLLISILAGCASTSPVYKNSDSPDAACITGDTANFFKFFFNREAHVHINEIDGVPTKGNGSFCFAAGKHRLGVSASNGVTAQDYVDLEFEANKKYQLRANLRGISMVFQLVDITREPELKLEEFSIKIDSRQSAMPIPIFIPMRR